MEGKRWEQGKEMDLGQMVNACPNCGSHDKEQKAVMSFRPLALCRDPWHDQTLATSTETKEKK